ncbi:sterol desaturase family protein [Cohnella zeiphila]|uniref:Sterol desaturase family protein n=1 Tax=Cohnella zeiphila TaxID=2761120 RepID=A0A7X0SJC6_9BACL|nr:sterol desaturase family protein [Cohnella zeiphila]MBB6731053.1 sterol desaturase family protein [Cohnella zeiphila]
MARYYREFFTNPMIAFMVALFVVATTLACVFYEGGRSVWGFVAGMAVYALFEYLVHRFLLHEFPKMAPAMYKGHVAHHDHPNDLEHLFSPLRYDAATHTGYFLVLWALTRDLKLVAAIMAGTALFQLYYQWMHYVAHRPITPITPWGRWMRKKHLLHHFMDDHAWYGVSHPALDIVMGTNKPQPKKKNTSQPSA